MAERRRLDAAIGRRIAIERIVAELLADRPAVLERGVYGLVRAAKNLGRAERRARTALAGDIHENRGFVAILRLHAPKNNISALPHPGGNHIGEGRAHSFRNRYSVDPELLVGVILTDIKLVQRLLHYAWDGRQNILNVVVIA